MKKTHVLSAAHHAHLSKIGVPWLRPPYLRVDEVEYQEAYDLWRRTHPSASPEWLRMKALGHIAWAQHRKESRDVKATPTRPIDHRFPLWTIAALLIILALAFFAPLAHCQFSKISTIQIQNNGTPISFHASPFAINFTGCTVSSLGTTDTITCTSGTVTNNPGGTANQLQFNSAGTAFGGIASAGLGKVLIDQGAGNLPAFADPLVQGTQAAGSTTLPSPVVSGGSDYGGTPAVRTWKVDSSGFGYVVFGAPQHVILDSGTVSLPSNASQETGGNLAIIAGIVSAGKAAITASQLPAALDGSGFLKTHEQGTAPISAASLPLPAGAATAAKQPALGTAGTPSADVISVQGVTSMTPLKVDPSGVTSPVSAASLPLPSGASTAAKQPALGTAGTPSADVITIQGVTSMTPLKVDGSATTQPVSAASLPLPSGAATAAKQPAIGTAGSPSADVITVQGSGSGTALPVNCTTGCAGGASTPADTFANPTTAGLQMNFGMLWNGSTWDRFYGDKTNGAFVNIKNTITLPISAASLPLPSGAAQDATLTGGTAKVKITGNAGVALDAATGAAPPANAFLHAGLGSGATGGFLVGVPVGDTYKAINISTATTTLLVTGVSGRQVRITSLHLIAAGADNVALIEGTGATCGTGTAGMAGGTTAASGYNLAANGGLAFGSGQGTILQTVTAGDSVCAVTSAAVQLSGGAEYAIY